MDDVLTLDHLWLTFFWVLYFFIHSFLASNKVKLTLGKLLGNKNRYFRLAYNFISVLF
jgi:methanethiol S-methyltransferase